MAVTAIYRRFRGKKVAVVGGGNFGVEAAIGLAGMVSHVTLIEYDATLRADAVLVRKLRSLPNVTVITSAQTTEVTGDGQRVNGPIYRDLANGDLRSVALAGVFVQIGLVPNTDWRRGRLHDGPVQADRDRDWRRRQGLAVRIRLPDTHAARGGRPGEDGYNVDFGGRETMSLLQVIILAIVQGFAELLPISSSAHVIVAEKLLGLDPSSPALTLLLVMLHTGTMFAVIIYFWPQWRRTYFRNFAAFKSVAALVVIATACTAVIGEGVIKLIEKTVLSSLPNAEIEDMFGHLEFIAPALIAGGMLILVAGLLEKRYRARISGETTNPTIAQTVLIGAVQGLCLPFRGFSRSGATISVGMLAGVAKVRAEAFSFALAVVLTPPVVLREVLRLMRATHEGGGANLASVAMMSIAGALVAFVAGLFALAWLSRWLEAGRWYLFGIYCLIAGAVVGLLHMAGY